LPSRACEFRGCQTHPWVWRCGFGGRESIFLFCHTNEFCGKSKVAPEPRGAGSAHRWGRWTHEEGRRLRRAAATPSPYRISETHTSDLLYRLAGPEMASLAIGSRCASTPTKPVAQASRRTGVARQQWEAPPPTAAGWVLWATGRWRVFTAEQQGATTRRGHRHGRCGALSPPPGAPKPHGPQRAQCGGRMPWGTKRGKADCRQRRTRPPAGGARWRRALTGAAQ